MRFFKNHQKCVLNSVWYCEISLKFSLEKVNPFAWNGVANFGHGGHVCARFCFKRTVRHTVLCIWGWRGTVWWYWNITKRSLEKAASVREKFPNFFHKLSQTSKIHKRSSIRGLPGKFDWFDWLALTSHLLFHHNSFDVFFYHLDFFVPKWAL